MNVGLINKLLSVTSFIRFRSLYIVPVFFTYYFLELSKTLFFKLNFLHLFRLNTFIFMFTQSLFSFEFKLPLKNLKFSSTKNVRQQVRYLRELFSINSIASSNYSLNNLSTGSPVILSLLTSALNVNIIFSLILGLKFTKVLRKMANLINFYLY